MESSSTSVASADVAVLEAKDELGRLTWLGGVVGGAGAGCGRRGLGFGHLDLGQRAQGCLDAAHRAAELLGEGRGLVAGDGDGGIGVLGLDRLEERLGAGHGAARTPEEPQGREHDADDDHDGGTGHERDAAPVWPRRLRWWPSVGATGGVAGPRLLGLLVVLGLVVLGLLVLLRLV